MGIATEFLIENLAGFELPVIKLEKMAEAAGISRSTLVRARAALNIKPRKRGKEWYISLPENAEKHITIIPPKSKAESPFYVPHIGEISSDWAKVVIDDDGELNPKSNKSGLHIKIGAYEFKAEADFPMEKLSELLRGLGGDLS